MDLHDIGQDRDLCSFTIRWVDRRDDSLTLRDPKPSLGVERHAPGRVETDRKRGYDDR